MSVRLDEHAFDWDELLLFIQEQTVIPVIGKELLVVKVDDQDMLLESYLAHRLAECLDVNIEGLHPPFGLNSVSAQYVRSGGAHRKIYSSMKAIIDGSELPVPEPLKKLAEITDFRLFVSTTFDPLLRRAVDEVRFGGGEETRVLAFSPHRRPQDLPCEVDNLPHTFVYHLFGPLSSSVEFAVTEEDTLEFLHRLQSEYDRPRILFDEFRDRHLLFIGCGFPDWLARFFLRTVTNHRLSHTRDKSEVVADSHVTAGVSLSLFLDDCRVERYVEGDPVAFVSDLHRKWMKVHSVGKVSPKEPFAVTDSSPRAQGGAASAAKLDPPIIRGFVFMSYASEDEAIAAAWRNALREAGLDVWFDKTALLAGDAWSSKIQANIRRCSLFLPFISASSQQRLEGYFRREWKWAIERAHGMAESRPFLVPIVLDDIAPGADNIPPEFWKRQSVVADGGVPTTETVERLRMLVRQLRLREKGLE